MKYIVVDAALSGTGIRDKYENIYLSPDELDLSDEIKHRLNNWLQKYENEHYNGFLDDFVVETLDVEGKEIALMIKRELKEVKLEYFSDALMKSEII